MKRRTVGDLLRDLVFIPWHRGWLYSGLSGAADWGKQMVTRRRARRLRKRARRIRAAALIAALLLVEPLVMGCASNLPQPRTSPVTSPAAPSQDDSTDGGTSSTSPSSAPATQEPTTGPASCGAENNAAVPTSNMSVTRVGPSYFLVWGNVPAADCYVVTRAPGGSVRLPAGSATYVSPDAVELSNLGDLTKATVHPIIFSVTAYRGGVPIRRFGHFVPCPVYIYVAARGSGQNGMFTESYAQGLGDRGRRVLEGLRTATDNDQHSLPAIAVDYPAVAVAFSPSMQIEIGSYPYFYNQSVQTGVRNGLKTIALASKSCPTSKFILFGYSQGGQVIGNIYSALSEQERARVARVILFAEATYAPNDPNVVYLPKALAGAGIKGQRSAFPGAPDTLIESWCWDQDAVCQRPPRGHAFHGDVYDQYEKEAVARAANTLH